MATLPSYIYGDIVNDVLNVARTRVNDMLLTGQGFPGATEPGWQFNEVGGGTEAAGTNSDGSLVLRTQILFNAAWRKYQKYLANLGYRLLIADNVAVTGLPANTNSDPTVQSWLSWNGFNNGTTFASLPALPSDFYAPLKIEERVTGSSVFYSPMRAALEGLRNRFPRGTLNREFEWRTNALYLPGATGSTDLLLRYTRRLPDFPDAAQVGIVWYLNVIPIPNSLSPLAWFVAAEVLALRANQDTADAAIMCEQNGKNEADQIFNDQARADQRPPTVNQGVARAGERGGPGTSGGSASPR